MFQLNKNGYTMIELLVTISIFAIMLALGIPSMSKWVLASKARSASEFYVDGFSFARRQAVAHNAASRIVLTPNVNNGQMDWQVDICFPVGGVLCNEESGVWSTTSTAAANDPQGADGYTSVFRSADALPPAEVLVPTILPESASSIYYTPLGWVDTAYAARLTRLRLDPATQYAQDVPVVALVVTLAGMATKCDPTLPATDSRACPP